MLNKIKEIYIIICRSKEVRYIPMYALFLAREIEYRCGNKVEIITVMNNDNIKSELKELLHKNALIIFWETFSTKAYWYISNYFKIAQYLKQNTKNTLVFGGFWASSYGRYFKEYNVFDYIMEGFSIEEIVKLIKRNAMQNNRFLNVKGKLDWNTYNLDLKYLRNHKKYLSNNKTIGGYLTTFSCRNRCKFCYSNVMYNLNTIFSIRGLNKIKEDIEQIEKYYNFNRIIIKDLNFFYNPNRAFKIIDFLKHKKKKIITNLDVEVNTINEDLIKKFKSKFNIGTSLYIGLESFNEKHRKRIGKPFKDKKIYEVFKYADKYKIIVTGNIIMGLPWQTKEDINNEISNAIEYINKYKYVNIYLNIYKPEYGCDIQREYFKEIHKHITFSQLIKIYRNEVDIHQKKLYGNKFNFINLEKVYNCFRLINKIKLIENKDIIVDCQRLMKLLRKKLEKQLKEPYFNSALYNFIMKRKYTDFIIKRILPVYYFLCARQRLNKMIGRIRNN
ncbi:MAG: radical SAM protein [Spirochaetales bacterium]|nr:radical SAM protein [Spirochaetales bacterium]